MKCVTGFGKQMIYLFRRRKYFGYEARKKIPLLSNSAFLGIAANLCHLLGGLGNPSTCSSCTILGNPSATDHCTLLGGHCTGQPLLLGLGIPFCCTVRTYHPFSWQTPPLIQI